MNSDYVFLTLLLCMIEFVRGRINPNKFYSTFGNGTYYYQTDFSKHSSFLKLRDYLQSNSGIGNDSQKVILNIGDISVSHYDYDLKYQLYVYENVNESPNTGKLCHLKVFEIKELSNIYIFIENSEKPVNHIYWVCPSYGWCCGAECCQYYYKDPWPLLGPNFFELIGAAAIFISALIIPQIYRRWRRWKRNSESMSSEELKQSANDGICSHLMAMIECENKTEDVARSEREIDKFTGTGRDRIGEEEM
ncbi:Nuclear cap-binding protein subunit [Dirofilaria immitis]